jgi:glycosyltransferase involved in cell wall biosynthesis
VSQDIPAGTLHRPPALDIVDDDAWVFAAGSLRPARGLEDLLRAVALLTAGGRQLRLVVAGEADAGTRRFADGLFRDARAMGIDERVHWLGHISAAEMGWCFRHAAAFVMTSRAEACPNTVLEAMAHGAVSISTDQQPMPEFFGDTAAYYPACDAGALAGRIDAALALGAADRAPARAAARQRARAYTWEHTVAGTVAALQNALT